MRMLRSKAMDNQAPQVGRYVSSTLEAKRKKMCDVVALKVFYFAF